MGDSMATAGLDCLAFAVNWMPGKGGVYCIGSVCGQSPDQGLIAPVEVMRGKHLC